MNIGNAIKLVRNHKNISQAKLAKSVNISAAYLSLIESGKREPNFKLISKISKSLEIPLYILVFLSIDSSEIKEISQDLYQTLSTLSLEIIREQSV